MYELCNNSPFFEQWIRLTLYLFFFCLHIVSLLWDRTYLVSFQWYFRTEKLKKKRFVQNEWKHANNSLHRFAASKYWYGEKFAKTNTKKKSWHLEMKKKKIRKKNLVSTQIRKHRKINMVYSLYLMKQKKTRWILKCSDNLMRVEIVFVPIFSRWPFKIEGVFIWMHGQKTNM